MVQTTSQGSNALASLGVSRYKGCQRLSIILSLTIMFAVGLIMGLPTSSFACNTTTHCYAIDNWSELGTAGLNLNMKTDEAYVPNPKVDRMQNEAWAIFNNGGWVEAGGTTGYIGYNHPKVEPGFVYFEAADNGYEYSETDQPNGPGGGNYWNIDIHYAPSYNPPGWYIRQNNQQMVTYPNLPSIAYRLNGGLEETNSNIVNWGTANGLAWWDANTGALHTTGWGIEPETVGPTCFYMPSQTTFNFKASSPPCNGTYGPMQGGNEASSGATESSQAEAPYASGTVTTGSEQSQSGVEGFARELASKYSAEAISSQESVKTTARSAIEAPGFTEMPTSAASSAMREWLGSDAYLEILKGSFTMQDVPRPEGHAAPHGTVLSLVIDAHTGQLVSRTLSNTTPSSAALAKLGTVKVVSN